MRLGGRQAQVVEGHDMEDLQSFQDTLACLPHTPQKGHRPLGRALCLQTPPGLPLLGPVARPPLKNPVPLFFLLPAFGDVCCLPGCALVLRPGRAGAAGAGGVPRLRWRRLCPEGRGRVGEAPGQGELQGRP